MNILAELSNTITGPQQVMRWFRKTLTQCDPEYGKKEKQFQDDLESFQCSLEKDRSISLDEVIAAEETRMAHNLIYLIWSGFQINLACFYDSTKRLFLNLDYEDIHNEYIMKSFPSSAVSNSLLQAFSLSLTEAQREQDSFIIEYYSYWETVAYKIAHYIGFHMGNELFPILIPGYVPDYATAAIYRMELKNLLHIDLRV